MIRNLIGVFGVVLVMMLGLTAYHAASVNSMAEQPVPFFHWEDTTGTSTVTDAIQARSFLPVRKRRINFGYTESAHWFRFRLVADSLPVELSFEIRNHTIDRLELFEQKNGRIISLGKTGSRLPFARRPSPTKTFVYLLTLAAGQSADYYLRLDKRHENLATELTLWQTSDFEDKEQREYFLWGIFAGVAGLVVLLAFLFYAATRDPVYGCFGLYILALTLRQFADTGLGFQYLWPGLPALNQPDALTQAIWLYVPAMLQFQQYFLNLRAESRPVSWATQLLKSGFMSLFIGLLVYQVLGLTESYAGANRLIRLIHSVMLTGVYPVFIAVIVVGLRSSDVVKRVYAVGLCIQLTGQIFVVAQNVMGFQPNGVFFVDAYMILMVNFFIDLVVFTYLLAYRYRTFIDEQRRLEVGLARTQQHTNEAIIDVLESERQQVGQLLRTDVGGRLAATQTLVASISPAPLLIEATNLLAKADMNLDQILRDNLSPDLTRKGLAAGLAELVAQCCQTGAIRLTFSDDGSLPAFPPTQTRQLYRMTNELINNIVKHANATEGQVSLQKNPAGWQLTVSDNGRGFDLAQARTAGGIGLKNIYARALTLGATVQLDSGPTGTTVCVILSKKIQTS